LANTSDRGKRCTKTSGLGVSWIKRERESGREKRREKRREEKTKQTKHEQNEEEGE
jgi:hypothetical protein